jgi:hypothetical protein
MKGKGRRPVPPSHSSPDGGADDLDALVNGLQGVDMNVGLVEDGAIELTEEDFNDPALTTAYETLIDGDADDEADGDVAESIAAEPVVAAMPPRPVPSPPPPLPPPPLTKSMSMSAEQCKARALQLSKEGNKADAVKWLKVAKIIEAGGDFDDASKLLLVPTLPSPTGRRPPVSNNGSNTAIAAAPSNTTAASTITAAANAATDTADPGGPAHASSSSSFASSSSSSSSSSAREARFALLESALTEAKQQAIASAKRLKAVDEKAAVSKMREYKRYEQELVVLESRRRTTNAEPAPFYWRTVVKEVAAEHLDIGEDQLALAIDGVFDLEGALAGHSSRNITVAYDLGIPRDEPATGKVNGKVDPSWGARLNHKQILPVIKRGRTLQQHLARKKATFEVILNRGMFFSSVSLGTATLPLADLLTKCECGGTLQLARPAEPGRRASTMSAGSVVARVRLRKPVAGPELVRFEERVLVLEPWPAVDLNGVVGVAAETPATPAPSQSTESIPTRSTSAPAPAPPLAAPPAQVDRHTRADFSLLTAREKNDPCAVEFLESNDVLDAELTAVNAALAQLRADGRSSSGTDVEGKVLEYSIRSQMLAVKLTMLQQSVENETLSLADYLVRLQDRLRRDEVLLKFFVAKKATLKDPDDVPAVAKHEASVRQRMAVMRSEIEGAQGL